MLCFLGVFFVPRKSDTILRFHSPEDYQGHRTPGNVSWFDELWVSFCCNPSCRSCIQHSVSRALDLPSAAWADERALELISSPSGADISRILLNLLAKLSKCCE